MQAAAQINRAQCDHHRRDERHLDHFRQLVFGEHATKAGERVDTAEVRHDGFEAGHPASSGHGTQDGGGTDDQREHHAAQQPDADHVTQALQHAGLVCHDAGIKRQLLDELGLELAKQQWRQRQHANRADA